MHQIIRHVAAWLVAISLPWAAAGCRSSQDDSDAPEASDDSAENGHALHGWWCSEHGVPEVECSLCSADAARQFKEAGDWCDEHHRAASQCFVCDPARADAYAALYEAKYHEPPPARAE
jgi:hypothetical protein